MKHKSLFLGVFLGLVAAGMVFATGGQQSAAASGKKIVKIWSNMRADEVYVRAQIAKYNAENPDNIEAQLTINGDNAGQILDLALQTGGIDAPDIMLSFGTPNAEYERQGQYVDINPLADADFLKLYGDQKIENINVINGKWYGPGVTTSTWRLFYNKDIFRRVGLSEPPTTMPQLVEYAKKITDTLKGEGIYGFAANMMSSGQSRGMWPISVRSFGHYAGLNYATGKYDFTEWYDMIMAYKQLLSPEIAFPGCEALGIDPLRAQFAQGKIGMYFSFIHAEPGVYATQFPTTVDWGAAQVPTMDGTIRGAQNFSSDTGPAWLINAKTNNTEASWKVMKNLLLSLPFLVGEYEAGLIIPIVPAVVAAAKPSKVYAENPILLPTATDAVWPPSIIGTVAIDGPNWVDITSEIIYSNYSETQVRNLLRDLTDRYNRSLQEALDRGEAKQYIYANIDPLHPSNAVATQVLGK
jgi:multiple sugar transport system substrate-binding protein